MELEKIQKIVAGVLNVDPAEVNPVSTLTYDLGADSLDSYQIFTKIEEMFHVHLKPEDVESCATIGDIIQVLKKVMKK